MDDLPPDDEDELIIVDDSLLRLGNGGGGDASASAAAPGNDGGGGGATKNASSSGRATLFCCLSCGMPFLFPDRAYTSEDPDVRDMIMYVHKIRTEISSTESSSTRRAGPFQWQLNKSHYIHRYLHSNLTRHVSTTTATHWKKIAMRSTSTRVAAAAAAEAAAGSVPPGRIVSAHRILIKDSPETSKKRVKSWSKEQVAAFSSVINCARFPSRHGPEGVEGQARQKKSLFFVFDEAIMEFTSDLCYACNNEATSQARVMGMLFGSSASSRDKAAFQPFLNVPMSTDLPLGSRMLHDTYLFIHIVCCILSAFLWRLHSYSSPPSQAQAWRLKGLIRLYVGFLLFTLSDVMNAGKRGYTFEQWYMFYFYDLQVWEKMQDPDEHGITVLTDLSSAPSNMFQPLGASNFGATLGFDRANEQVCEVANRVAQLGKQYWFLLDPSALAWAKALLLNQPRDAAASTLDQARAKAVARYVNWLPMNPDTNSVARLYVRQGIAGVVCSMDVAPFCCSRQLYMRGVRERPLKVVAEPMASRRRENGVKKEEDEEDDNGIPLRDRVLYNESSPADMDMGAYNDIEPLLVRGMADLRLRQALFSSKLVYVDKHVFLHRLYVGLSSNFGTRTDLHQMLHKFLPVTHAVLASTLSSDTARARRLASDWVRGMRESLQAAQEASTDMRLPAFHQWALVYRA